MADARRRGRERHRRLALSFVANFGARGVSILTILVTTPLLYRTLGAERFGVWMAVSSLVGILGFADLGIASGLQTIVSHAHGREDRDAVRKAVSVGTVLLIGAALLLLVVAGAAGAIDWELRLGISDPRLYEEGRDAIAVLVACTAASLPLMVAQKVQAGYQEGFESALWQAFGGVLALAGVLAFAHVGMTLPWITLAFAGGPLVALAASFVRQFVAVRPWLRVHPRDFDRAVASNLIRLGALWAWMQAMAFVGMNADSMLISTLLDSASVGSFAVMAKILSGLLIAQMLSAPLVPAYSEALERNDLPWVRQTFARTLVAYSIYGVLSALVMGVGSAWLVEVWVGPELVPTPGLALGFACWSFIVNLFSAISALTAHVTTLRRLVVLTSVGALTALVLKLLLVSRFSVEAVVWANCIGYGAVCVPGLLLARRLVRGETRSGAVGAR